jgi:predicted permease
MSDTIVVLLPVFLTIALGAVLKQTALIRDEQWSAIEHIAYYVLFRPS